MQHLSLIRDNEKANRPPKPLTTTGPSTLLQQDRTVFNAEPEALRRLACRLDEQLDSRAETVFAMHGIVVVSGGVGSRDRPLTAAKVRKVGLAEFFKDRLIGNSPDCYDDE